MVGVGPSDSLARGRGRGSAVGGHAVCCFGEKRWKGGWGGDPGKSGSVAVTMVNGALLRFASALDAEGP